jgi:DNA topoisomerase VI subunit B
LPEWDDKIFLRVCVKDNGPGISQGDLQKLFKPFSKLSSTSQLNPNGSGLGLYNCKLICTSLGGDITIESELNKGTKVTFWTQVDRSENNPNFAFESARHQIPTISTLKPNTKVGLTFNAYLDNMNKQQKHKFRIICADDMFLNLEALRIAFVNMGLVEHCQFVRNGQEVVEACLAEVG